jgi:hypothetical protein
MSSTVHFSVLILDPLSAVWVICITLISLHTIPSMNRCHPIASCALAISLWPPSYLLRVHIASIVTPPRPIAYS